MTDIQFSNEAGGPGDARGFGPRRRLDPARLAEAGQLVSRAMSGNRRASLDLQEAMSTSDFPDYFGDILDRSMLAQYQEMPQQWRSYAMATSVRDFRSSKLLDLIGGRGLLDAVDELGSYPERSLTEGEYTLSVSKFGARFAISWEAMVNDDLGGLRSLPQRLADAAHRSEENFATKLIATASGPADFFTNTGTAPLSTPALSDALTSISTQLDPDDGPIMVDAQVLVVPPALEVTARNIVGATEIRQTDSATGQTVIVGNWLSNRVQVVVNPWLPLVDTSANKNKTWYLLPSPSTPRPAVAFATLRGHEVPELRVKADTGNALGGGGIDPTDGSFDIDDIQYRVRHVFGGTTVDPIAAYASTGAGDDGTGG